MGLYSLAEYGVSASYQGNVRSILTYNWFPSAMDTAPHQMSKRETLADSLSSGIARIDLNQRITWANKSFCNRFAVNNPVGESFYDIFVDPVLIGPDYCPIETVRSTGRRTSSRLWIGSANKRLCFEFNVNPDFNENGQIEGCLVETRDVTELMLDDETLRKLQNVGRLLVDLSSDELALMSAEERKSLLAERIRENMREILAYDAFEFRLYDKKTETLLPFTNFGIEEGTSQRPLLAATVGGGISGYVASTKQSFLCEDTVNEPGYVPGLKDARCSITVPILWYDKLIGTCNVESKTPGAFTDRDTYFLKIFAQDVAAALHTLDLLCHEEEFGAQRIVDRIFHSVSIQIDQIIQKTSHLLDRNRNDFSVSQVLEGVLRHSRTIHDQIAVVLQSQAGEHSILVNRRVLVIDKDESNVEAARHVFEPYGCSVESASNTETALAMIRHSHYDVIISELYPEGMNGFHLLIELQDMFPEQSAIPLVLAQDIGIHDKGHIATKARARGLIGTIARPLQANNHFFKIVELAITTCGQRDAEGNLLPPVVAQATQSSPPKTGNRAKAKCDQAQWYPGEFYHKQGADQFNAWQRIGQNDKTSSDGNDF